MKAYNRFYKVLGALLLALCMNEFAAFAQTNVLRIGEVAFVSERYELYTDFGQRIQARSPCEFLRRSSPII